MVTNIEPIKTANAEILCNRDDLDDLLMDEEKENENTYGKIILREYMRLLNSENAKINFILKILSKAVNEHKIFVIYGIFPPIRKPLGQRGWIEKKFIRKMLSMSPEISEAGLETVEKLLRCPPNFIWYSNKRASIRTEDRTIVNKFTGCYFTSKVDMCNNLENISWYYEADVSNVQFPRCYNVYQPAQIEEFIQDFYITASMGILKWFLYFASVVGPNAVWSEDGTIPIKAILFALERCSEYISVCAHEDIDGKHNKDIPIPDWNEFLSWYKKILQRRGVLQKKNEINIEELLRYTSNIMKRMMQCRPQTQIDGMRNIWIIKPGDKSLGKERPLLVHRTKVDIRQWFLITSTQPLTVWIYKDILVRFASKNFTLNNFHESIHLCNTTVQLKYRKTIHEGAPIPSELHWNLHNFKEYLKAIDRELAWEKLIKPGIKQNLIGALLASQENMVNRKNSFQLYGADFLIMDDLSVWLIEINTNPRLHPPSSSVTEKLYPEIIEDTIKVVLDRRKNKKAARGKFECIYRQRNPFYRNVLGKGVSLGIRGKAVFSKNSIRSRL
ncbi:tubulin glycylase 3A-like isoform X2 [Apis cerana]|uniref:tubulin glycylase 3A-like isoform X2 n=1 Tax=Apis cerana TaxID=7461 RepID=UPI0007E2B50B|nr:tubulin glycylase 3A-like isoform X2 [Apis cerana]